MELTVFDKIIERKGTNSLKWDYNDEVFGYGDVLPMWVADMDFQAPQVVLDALAAKIQHGVFGYTRPAKKTAESIMSWVKKRHNWIIDEQSIVYSPGVVTSMAFAIQAFSSPGDKIALLTPVYYPFFHLIEKNNRELVSSQLIVENNQLEIDFEDVKRTLTQDVKLLLLCNPHNPGGKVWSEEELKEIGQICLDNEIIIISDDIHCDLLVGEKNYTPISSLSEDLANNTITFIAPSKTFNLAGLQASAAIIPNRKLRTKFSNVMTSSGFHQLNLLGSAAMETAYLHGEKWLDELLIYLKENIDYLVQYISKNIPKIKVIQPEASYLVWLDCRSFELTSDELKQRILEKGKLSVNLGETYGKGGEGFIRINVGCPRSIVAEGLARLKSAFEDLA